MDHVNRLLSRLRGVTPGTGSDQWTARCPAHDDATPSLSVGLGEADRILLFCHAGCGVDDVVAALDLTLSDLFPSAAEEISFEKTSFRRRITDTYDYHDATGTLLYQVVRLKDPKDFRQRRPDGRGGWTWSTRGIERVPYRLPKLLAAVKCGRPVLIVEGEKDVETALSLGGDRRKRFCPTTSSGGVGKWPASFRSYFQDAQVWVVPDLDDPGYAHAESISDNLRGTAASLKILRLPMHGHHLDLTDWAGRGGTADLLVELAEATPYLWHANRSVPRMRFDQIPGSSASLEAVKTYLSGYDASGAPRAPRVNLGNPNVGDLNALDTLADFAYDAEETAPADASSLARAEASSDGDYRRSETQALKMGQPEASADSPSADVDTPTTLPSPTPSDSQNADQRRRTAGRLRSAARSSFSQETLDLVNLLRSEGVRLVLHEGTWHAVFPFVTDHEDRSVSDRSISGGKAYALDGPLITPVLLRLALDRTGTVPHPNVCRSALSLLHAAAPASAPAPPIASRVGFVGNSVYIDAGEHSIIRVDPYSWSYVDHAPVVFLRDEYILPLPRPSSSGSLELLREVLGINQAASWVAIRGWLLGALFPFGAVPPLLLEGASPVRLGEMAHVIASVVDPRSRQPAGVAFHRHSTLRTTALPSRHVHRVEASAQSAWLEELLGITITPAGHPSSRILLTNPSGFDVPPSVRSRALVVSARRAAPDVSRTSTTAAFDAVHAAVFGALLDGVSACLKGFNHVTLPTAARTAPYAAFLRWTAVADDVLDGIGPTFLEYWLSSSSHVPRRRRWWSRIRARMRAPHFFWH